MLKVTHLTKKYGKVLACNDLNFHLEPGSVTVLLGPNGAGKSTLLRCATLLETMDRGTLAFGDSVVAREGADGRSVYVGKNELRQVKAAVAVVGDSEAFRVSPTVGVVSLMVTLCSTMVGTVAGATAEVLAEVASPVVLPVPSAQAYSR